MTHIYEIFATRGYQQHLVSPRSGGSPLESRILGWFHVDASVKAWLVNKAHLVLPVDTTVPEQVDAGVFGAIYFTDGHDVMWDFPDDVGLQCLTCKIYQRDDIVLSVCHGYCGLLNTHLDDDRLLVAGYRLTGYSWIKEMLTRVARKTPYNAEEEIKRHDALYKRGLLPLISKIVVDGHPVTEQNPQSAKATAEQVAALLD